MRGEELRCLLKEWAQHSNHGCPHMALGPGIPLPPPQLPASLQAYRHRIPQHLQGVVRLILGGYIMNTSWKRRRRDGGSDIIAEHNGAKSPL